MKIDSITEKMCANIAHGISQIICATTDASVIASWGIRSTSWAILKDKGDELPCLVLHVSGLVHCGLVFVAYDMERNWYMIKLMNAKAGYESGWYRGIYYEDIGKRIDELVERPVGMSGKEYKLLCDFVTKLAEENS